MYACINVFVNVYVYVMNLDHFICAHCVNKAIKESNSTGQTEQDFQIQR